MALLSYSVRRFAMDGGHDELGPRVTGAIVSNQSDPDQWTVSFRPTAGERYPSICLHASTFELALAAAQKCVQAIDRSGGCRACNHSHVGRCAKVLSNRDGWETRCECMAYPDHGLNHEWLDGKR